MRVGEVNEGWIGQTRDGCGRQRMGWADEVGGVNEEWVGQMRWVGRMRNGWGRRGDGWGE